MDQVYALVAAGKTSEAVDAVIDLFDDLLLAGRVSAVEQMLRAVEVSRLDVPSMLAVLAATRAARFTLKQRSRVYFAIEAYLIEHHENRAERLLHGLR